MREFEAGYREYSPLSKAAARGLVRLFTRGMSSAPRVYPTTTGQARDDDDKVETCAPFMAPFLLVSVVHHGRVVCVARPARDSHICFRPTTIPFLLRDDREARAPSLAEHPTVCVLSQSRGLNPLYSPAGILLPTDIIVRASVARTIARSASRATELSDAHRRPRGVGADRRNGEPSDDTGYVG